MCGGGGTSGRVAFPTHMEETHQDWLGHTVSVDEAIDTSLIAVMNTALGVGGNPYENQTLTDPATEFTAIETRYDILDTLVTGLDAQTDWETFVDAAQAKLDTAGILDDIDISTILSDARAGATLETEEAIAAAIEAINDVVIRSVVKSAERRADDARRRSINRFSGTMADINSVNSSAYIFGMALIESSHLQQVADFDANLTSSIFEGAFNRHMDLYRSEVRARLQEALNTKGVREQLLAQSVSVMSQSLLSKAELDNAVTGTRAEIGRLRTVATQEYELSEIDIDAKFSEWDFRVFHHGAQVLGGIGGGTALPEGPSRVGSAIGGALSGAGTGALAGASIGAAGGPIGAGGGAVIGGILGLASALF